MSEADPLRRNLELLALESVLRVAALLALLSLSTLVLTVLLLIVVL